MRRRRPQAQLPGVTLSRIGHGLFAGDPIVESLDALIADAQREWLQSHGRARRLRAELACAFWRSTLVHTGKLLLIPSKEWVRLAGGFATWTLFGGLAAALLILPGATPHEIALFISNLFIIGCGPAALVFHPANVERLGRVSTVGPGWWPLARFLILWLIAFWIWLVWIDGHRRELAIALASSALGLIWATLRFSTARRSQGPS